MLKNKKGDEGFQNFLTYKKRYSNYNVFQIASLATRIESVYGITKPCQEDAYRIEDDLRARSIKNSTIRHYLKTLELMAEYRGFKLDIKKPKPIYTQVEHLTKAESYKLLEACKNARDRAIISVLLFCGLRAKELISLNIEDIDLKDRYLFVRDRGQGIKNRHERRAVMNKQCTTVVSEWLRVRPRSADGALFMTIKGDRISPNRLNRIVKKVAKRAGIEKRVYTHLLRHTCGTTMIKSGIPITEVMLQLGHRSLTSTMVYLHGDLEGLKQSIDTKFELNIEVTGEGRQDVRAIRSTF